MFSSIILLDLSGYDQITSLSFAAYFSSIVSAILGATGGILLLSWMLSLLPLTVTVPLHGLVQLSSNFTRTVVFRAFIQWKIIFFYSLGVLPGGLTGYLFLKGLKEDNTLEIVVRLGFGIFIISSVLKDWFFQKSVKVPLSSSPEGFQQEIPISLKVFPQKPLWPFIFAGAIASSLGVVFGATGPIIATFFLRPDLEKNQIIATKAGCQFLTHLIKIPVFFALTFNYFLYKEILAAMIFCVVLGTITGKKLGNYLSEKAFKILFSFCLLMAGFRLTGQGITFLMGGR